MSSILCIALIRALKLQVNSDSCVGPALLLGAFVVVALSIMVGLNNSATIHDKLPASPVDPRLLYSQIMKLKLLFLVFCGLLIRYR